MLTSIYSYFPGMNMTEAAHLYLQADTILYDAEHSDIISILFCERGLLANCADTLPTDHPPSDPFVANHEAFSLNKGPLIVYPNGNSSMEIELFDIHGKLLESYSFKREQILYELPEKTATYRGIHSSHQGQWHELQLSSVETKSIARKKARVLTLFSMILPMSKAIFSIFTIILFCFDGNAQRQRLVDFDYTHADSIAINFPTRTL